MDEQALPALLAALVLASVHLFAGRMRFLEGIPRSRWLSAAGGVSVAYVFVHLLPELAEGQKAVEGRGGEAAAQPGPFLDFLEDQVWLVALLGLVVFYAVEQHSLSSRGRRRQRSGEDQTEDVAFRLSIGLFAVYNAIVGLLLLSEDLEATKALVLYTVALAVHFVVNDAGLRDHHKDAYRRIGRWAISGAVLAGWAVGVTTEIPERAIVLVLAFVAGGVVLNVFKEELPGERRAQLWPFVAGTAGYALLLQLS